MEKFVSFRIGKLANHKVLNQINHDMRIGWQPSYIDYEKMADNRLIYGEKFDKKSYYDLRAEQSKRSKRKIQKNTERFSTGIFTFSQTMKEDYKNSPEVFNNCSKKFCEKLEEEFGLQISYAELHLDETTPHVHILFDNISKIDGKSIRRNITPDKLSKAQTLMGECFEPMGYKRGEENSKRKHLNVKELHEINEAKEKLKNELKGFKDELKLFDKILKNEPLTEQEKEVLKIIAPSLFQFVKPNNDIKAKKEISKKVSKLLKNN